MYTCEGAAQLLISNGHHPEREIDRVTTPMGCTIEGLNEMEYKGLSSALIKGMLASFHKISSIKEDQVWFISDNNELILSSLYRKQKN